MNASLLVLIVPLAVACGADDGGAARDTRDSVQVDAEADAPPDAVADIVDSDDASADTQDADDADTVAPSSCDPYPIPLVPDRTARVRAGVALAQLAPGATLDWNELRGTLNSALNLDLPLPGCVGDANLYDQAWAKMIETPGLFQLDRSEWQEQAPAPCSIITDQSTLLNFSRKTLGGEPVAKDVFVFRFVRVDGVVNLASVNGAYVPATTPELTTRLQGCPDLDESAVIEALAEFELPFSTFDQCAPTGSGVYVPKPGDRLEFDAAAFWLWDDDPIAGGVSLTKNHQARLIVAPANVTPELIASDANCPEPLPGDGRIYGFTITFDAITGALLFSMPGIGCIVC